MADLFRTHATDASGNTRFRVFPSDSNSFPGLGPNPVIEEQRRQTLDADIARNPATRHASPVWLADRLRADWPVRWTQLLAAGDAQAPMWLRINSRTTTTEEYLGLLRDPRGSPRAGS